MTKITEYVKIAKAAKILGVVLSTVRKWAGRGDILMRRNPAGYRRFKRSDLAMFLHCMKDPIAPPRTSKPR